MNSGRILAILRQELYITKRSLEVIFDLFFFTMFNLVLFGFISLYLSGQQGEQTAHTVLMGFLLWEVIRLTQYTVTVQSLWNVWSHNLTNIFISPISMAEYMTAHMLSGVLKTSLIFGAMSALSALVFRFNIFAQLGIVNLLIFYFNLTVFAWSAGLVLLGLVFRYGTRIQAISWGVIFIFQPLTAAFFPLEVLPSGLRTVAQIFPPTYVFEAARGVLAGQPMNWAATLTALGLNLAYFGLACLVFSRMFRKSKETGQFARNDA